LKWIYALTQLIMLVTFHFKMIICLNFNLPHTNYQSFEKPHLWDENDHEKMWNHMWNWFWKIHIGLNSFQFLLEYIYILKKSSFFFIILLGLCSTIICKNIVKLLSIDMVYIQKHSPKKMLQCNYRKRVIVMSIVLSSNLIV
jgi:hypothetical protein